MTPKPEPVQPKSPAAQIVEIRIRGHLDRHWTDWFDGLQAEQLETGETVLSGPVADQAALLGLLNKLNRLNLTILSVNEAPLDRGGSALSRPDPAATQSSSERRQE